MLPKAKHLGKLLLRPTYRRRWLDLRALSRLPRYTSGTTTLLGPPIRFADAASFLSMYRYIFEGELYRFGSRTSTPRIIDAGANIGLGVLYFKQHWPECVVLAFEPDPSIFAMLQQNTAGLTSVELINKALWSVEGTLPFTVEGADAGSVVRADNSGAVRVVETVRLRPYLETGVDFLKLDIEGAETEVLEDSADLLGNVKCVFVEYHSFVDKPQTLHTVAGILSGAGFRLHVHSELVSPTPFQKRESYLGMDMLLHLFGFRD